MKIMAVNTKTAVATAVYYLAIITLVVFVGIIVYRLLFWSFPPCTTSEKLCLVDSWSLAGITATILGVAATLLAVLGAVAVAAWWTNLNAIVDKRVDEQVKGRIEEIKRTLREEQVALYTEQKKEVEAIRANMQNEIAVLHKLVEGIGLTCDAREGHTQKDMILLAMKHEPWTMEEWADGVLLHTPSSEVAIRMIIRYLTIMKDLISDDESTRTKCVKHLEMVSAPSDDYHYYWDAALRWRDRVMSQGNPSYIATAQQITGEDELLSALFLADMRTDRMK